MERREDIFACLEKRFLVCLGPLCTLYLRHSVIPSFPPIQYSTIIRPFTALSLIV